MKLYRKTLRLIINSALKEGLKLFIIAICLVFIFNGLIWLVEYFNQGGVYNIIFGIFKIIIYFILPFYLFKYLISVFKRFGGGAMIVTFVIISLELILFFIIISLTTLIFVSWEELRNLFNEPINVIINLS